MSLGLVAPVAIPVQIRAADRRVFRLSSEIGERGIRLENPAPFEPGRPVDIGFTLPDDPIEIVARAELSVLGYESEQDGAAGGVGLMFLELPADVRLRIGRYVLPRIGLPAPG